MCGEPNFYIFYDFRMSVECMHEGTVTKKKKNNKRSFIFHVYNETDAGWRGICFEVFNRLKTQNSDH